MKQPLAAYQKERIITEVLEKTVGHGGDFTDINDALYWATRCSTTGRGQVKLSLLDGVHELDHTHPYMTLPDSGASADFAAAITCNFSMVADGENAANCIVTMKPEAHGKPILYCMIFGNYFGYMQDITFDLEYNGFDTSGNAIYWFMDVRENSRTEFIDCVFKNMSSGLGFINVKGVARTSGCTFDTIANGFSMNPMAKIYDQNATDTNVTTKYPVPVNVYHHNGRLIVDGNGPITFQA